MSNNETPNTPEEQFLLGMKYIYEESGYEQDEMKGFHLIKKSAEQGYAKAQYMLGQFYQEGNMVLRIPETSFEWIYKSAKQGFPPAIYSLYIYYDEGYGVEEDKATSLEYLALAAMKGHAVSQCLYALHIKDNQGYQDGIYFDEEPQKVFQLLKSSYEQGYDDAELYYGICLYDGYGVDKNEKEGFQIIEKFAFNGHPDAKLKLLSLNHSIEDDEQNKALMLYIKGNSYITENSDANELKIAFDYILESAKLGYEKAEHSVGLFYLDGIVVEKDFTQAAHWIEKSANKGYVESQCLLGMFFLDGAGVEQDIEKGIYWIKKSAEKHHPQAQHLLGLFYEEGTGVEQNIKKAVYWLGHAMENGFDEAEYDFIRCTKKL